jgi:O-antigen/teichoic acid export membrane protein
VANLFYFLLFAKTLFSWRPKVDKVISGEMLVYAYPIMFMGLAGMTNEMFSRITLEWWLPENFYPGQTSEYALGVFGACYKYAMLMSLVVQAFRYAAEPFFFSHAADKKSPQLFAKVNHFFVIACCVLLLGVSINLDILKYFLGDDAYWQGLHIVPILLLAYLLLGVYYNMSVWYKLTDKTYYGTFITVGGAVLTILMNYLLIPRLGYLGSSWATLVCYFAMTTACYLLGKKYYPIPYNVIKGSLYIIVTLTIAYGVNSITIANQWMATGFHLIVLTMFIGGLYMLEKDYLKEPA